MGKNKNVLSLVDSKIRILGDNILYNDGVLNAYYILPLFNYSVASSSGIEYIINDVTSVLTSLSSRKRDITYSIQTFEKIIRKKDVLSNLLETIRLYEPNADMPDEFTKNLGPANQTFCLLSVEIDTSDIVNIESLSIKETAKEVGKNFINKLMGLEFDFDLDKIFSSEENIFMTLKQRCVRASKELVFYQYVSKLYPSYEISYDKLSFFNDTRYSDILGAVTQTVEDKFGYFIMHNEGIDLFDLDPQDTYGCILDVKEFPIAMNTSDFELNYPGTQVVIKSISKEQASIKIKRTRAADRYEQEEAEKAGAEIEQLEKTLESIDIATHALQELDAGVQMCTFNCSILVTGTTLQELKENVLLIQHDLKNKDVLAAKSLNQAKDFIDYYLKLRPRKFEHFSSLAYCLAFRLNAGSVVGDLDNSKFFVPAIGVDI